jgi:hypothetical protein
MKIFQSPYLGKNHAKKHPGSAPLVKNLKTIPGEGVKVGKEFQPVLIKRTKPLWALRPA